MIDLMTVTLGASIKSQQLAQSDPHGFIMTLTAVAVVFSSLLILYIFFELLGKFTSGKVDFKKMFAAAKKKPAAKGGKELDEQTLAAITMALEAEMSPEVHAAIGLALGEYLEKSIHDQESYIITIKRN